MHSLIYETADDRFLNETDLHLPLRYFTLLRRVWRKFEWIQLTVMPVWNSVDWILLEIWKKYYQDDNINFQTAYNMCETARSITLGIVLQIV